MIMSLVSESTTYRFRIVGAEPVRRSVTPEMMTPTTAVVTIDDEAGPFEPNAPTWERYKVSVSVVGNTVPMPGTREGSTVKRGVPVPCDTEEGARLHAAALLEASHGTSGGRFIALLHHTSQWRDLADRIAAKPKAVTE